MSTPAYTEQSLGKRGSVVYDSSSGAITNQKFAILVAGPSGVTFSSLTCTNKTNASTKLISKAFPAGYTTYGNFTGLTVSAGEVEAYNA